MSTAKTLTGIALATAAAAMFVLAPLPATAGDKTVKCMGVNACKGRGSCKTASSAGKGQNSCKGQGFVEVSKEVCDQLGGKVG
jgi:hypothetical protein